MSVITLAINEIRRRLRFPSGLSVIGSPRAGVGRIPDQERGLERESGGRASCDALKFASSPNETANTEPDSAAIDQQRRNIDRGSLRSLCWISICKNLVPRGPMSPIPRGTPFGGPRTHGKRVKSRIGSGGQRDHKGEPCGKCHGVITRRKTASVQG